MHEMNSSYLTKSRLAVICCVLYALLAACASAPPETRQYQLNVRPDAMQATDEHKPTLAVDVFSVDAAYDQQQIVYRESHFRVDQYYYQRWAAMPGRLVSDAMRQGLGATGLFRTVISGRSTPADAILSGHVAAIEEVDRTRRDWAGHLALELHLRDTRTGELLWSAQFDREVALTQQDPTGLAAAMSQILTDIVVETAPTIAHVARQASVRPDAARAGQLDP